MQVRAKVSNPNRIGRVLFTNFSDPRTYSGSIQYLALLFYVCSPVGVHDEGVSQRRTRLAVVHNVRVTLAKPRKDSLEVFRLRHWVQLAYKQHVFWQLHVRVPNITNHLQLFRSVSRRARLRIPAHYLSPHRSTLSGRRRRLAAAAVLNARLVSRADRASVVDTIV
jgi:hypothetical protein